MANPTITFTGRLAKDVVVLSNGGLKLRVVTNDRIKNDQGEWQDSRTSFWNVKVWNKLAEQLKDVLVLGMEIQVTGTIYQENWVDQETKQERQGYDIKADSIAITPHGLKKLNNVSPGSWTAPVAEVPF